MCGKLRTPPRRSSRPRRLDLATGQVTTLTGHAYAIEAAAFSPDGRTLATASDDATVRLWDLATGRTTTTLTPHGGYAVSVAFSPDGRTPGQRQH